MRDLLIVGIVFAASLYALRQPWVGVMLWTWLSLMNPHALAYGFSQSFPVAAIAAGATLIGLLTTADRRNPFSSAPSIWLTLFMIWICITYVFSYNVDGSTDMLKKVMKIDVMILVSLALLSTKKHITIFIWIVAISLGFYGVKGGIFTIISGGNYRVWGPGGFIGGNNEIALALIIAIPFMYYLMLQAKARWTKYCFIAAMSLSAAAALGSHSRGALLGIAAMAIYLWIKAPRKILVGTILIVLAVGLLAFMPENWTERMNTITSYEEDSSAMGRINAWWTAYNVATSNFTGAGFDMYTREIFAIYAPNPNAIHAAHSIYFQVLGEHGIIGLFLFLGLWWSVWKNAGWLIKHGAENAETLWCKHLGSMCQVSLVGYAVGGAFLSLAYFDLPYNALIMVVLSRKWMEQKAWLREASESQTETPIIYMMKS